jgi:hypothetical protein
MPCSSDGWPSSDTYRELENATQAACELARAIRSTRVGSTLWDELSKKTKKWVERHDRIDRQRIKREKEEKRRKKLKKQALKKLSRKEREVLGIGE